MFRKLLIVGSTALVSKTFKNNIRLDDMARLPTGEIGLETQTHLTDLEGEIVIKRTVQADPHHSKWKFHTVTTVEDRLHHETAKLVENPYWGSDKIYFETAGKQTEKVITGETPEEKCSEIQDFLRGNKLVATLFCASSKGDDLEDALQKEGHKVLPQCKI